MTNDIKKTCRMCDDVILEEEVESYSCERCGITLCEMCVHSLDVTDLDVTYLCKKCYDRLLKKVVNTIDYFVDKKEKE